MVTKQCLLKLCEGDTSDYDERKFYSSVKAFHVAVVTQTLSFDTLFQFTTVQMDKLQEEFTRYQLLDRSDIP